MIQPLRDLQHSQGAAFDPSGYPLTFGDSAAALQAATTGVALIDRSHWGLLEMTGGDRLRFIHNQTTNSFTQRQPGEGCDTVFVTSTARTIDLSTVYLTDDALLILTSPGQDQRLMAWMDRYMFPADQVFLQNLTGTMAMFSLVGPSSEALLAQLGVVLDPELGYGHHRMVELGDGALRLAVGSGLTLPGYTLILASAAAASVWQQLTEAAAVPAGEALWQQLRIHQGRPAPEAELTDDYNPLEAGLWQTISFDKGCYIGQETIARLNTYQGVKQQLWGIELDRLVEAGAPIMLKDNAPSGAVSDQRVGTLTSVVATDQGAWGLGYIRTKAGGAGLEVTVGAAQGVVVDIPFASRGYLSPSG